MDRLENLIKENLSDFPDFIYYLPIIDKANKNQYQHPDITIECCNSLIQGICKTIILNLDLSSSENDFKKKDTQDIIKPALKLIKAGDNVYENDFATRAASLALAISTLRNARGDISHGKAVPKVISSNLELARTAKEITSSLLSYTLASYYSISLSLETDDKDQSTIISYDDNSDFNDYLDELYPLDGRVLYSEALYDKYYDDYEIQLSEYKEDILDEGNIE